MEEVACQPKKEDRESVTRNFPRYSVKEHMSFISLGKFLESPDKKQRSKNVALEMAVNVSIFLKFACGSAIQQDFEQLLDCDILLAYHDKLQRCGVGVHGQIISLMHWMQPSPFSSCRSSRTSQHTPGIRGPCVLGSH